MSNLIQTLSQLRRPRLLIRAGRCGQADYMRNRALRRLLQCAAPPSPEVAITRLLPMEDELNQARLEGAANYNALRHIEIMIAIMAEARIMQASANVHQLPIAAE